MTHRMKQLLAIALWVTLAACRGAEDDRIVGSWVYEGEDGREVTTFEKDGSVTQITAGGDTLAGFYTFVNRTTIKVDVAFEGDSLAYLWELDFEGDSLIVGLPNDAYIGLERLR